MDEIEEQGQAMTGMDPDKAERIGRYIDGAMDDAERADFERALASDASLADEVARLTGNDDRMRAAFELPVDDELLVRLGLADAAARPTTDNVIDFAAARQKNKDVISAPAPRRWMPWVGGLLAASVAALAIVPMLHGGDFDPQASAGFQQAMEQRPSLQIASVEGGVKVQPQGSFVDSQGRFCRDYALGGAASGSGIACRTGSGGWQVEATTKDGGIETDDGAIRTAGGAFDAALDAAHERIGASDPINGDQENRLIANGWQKSAR